jgi:hypothetical protein
MAGKVTEDDPQREHPDRSGRENALFDVRTLIVLLLSTGVGWLAHREDGWASGLSAGIATAVALHALLRR